MLHGSHALRLVAAQAQETLNVGANIGNVPWEFQDESGEFVGFEVELANAVASQLGREAARERVGQVFEAGVARDAPFEAVPALKELAIACICKNVMGLEAGPEVDALVVSGRPNCVCCRVRAGTIAPRLELRSFRPRESSP